MHHARAARLTAAEYQLVLVAADLGDLEQDLLSLAPDVPEAEEAAAVVGRVRRRLARVVRLLDGPATLAASAALADPAA